MPSDTVPDAREVSLEGHLELGGTLLPVRVTYASRISLFVSFQSGKEVADKTQFQKLILRLAEREIQLSACQLHTEYTRQGGSGRLVFLEDVYDCKVLLFQGRLINLKAFFQNLPLVLSQKEQIHREFRDYVSDSLYDLAVYKRFFNEQDRILANEPPVVATAAQGTLLRTEGPRFFQFFDGQLAALSRLVAGYDKEEHERHGFYLRRQAWEFILGSEFLKRTNLKPRGYAGDAEMMQMTYENQYVGNYVFNKLMHKHPLETPAAQAVRNRRRLVARVIKEAQQRFAHLPPHGFRFLSLASGPAWELQDIFLTDEDFHRMYCALLDQDTQALDCAREVIAQIEAARGDKISAGFFTDSVRTMLRSTRLVDKLGRFHFLYSMGLFDYLTPPVARAILAKVYELLVPGGSLVVGNYHVDNPSRYYMAYWMDWNLYYRTEEEFLALAEGLACERATVTYDETHCQMFLELVKPA